MSPSRTTILAKRPAPGSVKTRLCPPLEPEDAAALALAMLDDTLEKCLAETRLETSLAVAPPEALAWFRARYPRVREIAAQEGADLGARLAACFERGARVCIGSDAPGVPAERIVETHRLLEEGTDLVLGPDTGGGYYLVGLAQPVPELFTSIEMSTPDMFEKTLALASSLGLSFRLLEPDDDVDGPDDLGRLARDARAPRSSRLARELLTRIE